MAAPRSIMAFGRFSMMTNRPPGGLILLTNERTTVGTRMKRIELALSAPSVSFLFAATGLIKTW
ncbi:protein of unknown function [Candidatus Promineifilum breve]|uniref:Uncharacterized protein n=1 Tax=Candidatus Promineifilum breve TaxID=1806508 RepID=A0A170PF96_9CHLR|nr:protein of unknown function [Candidatus Promineifilum breve]